MRDAAFALAEGAVSAPVRGRFGIVLLRAAKVEPFNAAQAAEQARLTIATTMARNAVNDLHDRIEKERSSGLPLADIAAKVGVPVTTVDAVDQQGRDPQEVQLNLPGASDFLAPAFRAEVGLENEPVNNRETGLWAWFEVSSVTPARDRALDEVRPQVEARWREDEVKVRIGRAADQMATAIRGGKTLAEVAQPLNLEVRTTPVLKRSSTDGVWGSAAVQMLFVTGKGQASTVTAADGLDRIVFVTTEIVLPRMRRSTPAPATSSRSPSRTTSSASTSPACSAISAPPSTARSSTGRSAAPPRPAEGRRRPSCRSSRPSRPSPPSTMRASRRWCGRRSSPISRRRSPPT